MFLIVQCSCTGSEATQFYGELNWGQNTLAMRPFFGVLLFPIVDLACIYGSKAKEAFDACGLCERFWAKHAGSESRQRICSILGSVKHSRFVWFIWISRTSCTSIAYGCSCLGSVNHSRPVWFIWSSRTQVHWHRIWLCRFFTGTAKKWWLSFWFPQAPKNKDPNMMLGFGLADMHIANCS